MFSLPCVKAASHRNRSAPRASSSRVSVTPVSPEYVRTRPPCSIRMPYASTGWATRSVWTVKGPISNVPGLTVWKSKTSLMEDADGVSA